MSKCGRCGGSVLADPRDRSAACLQCGCVYADGDGTGWRHVGSVPVRAATSRPSNHSTGKHIEMDTDAWPVAPRGKRTWGALAGRRTDLERTATDLDFLKFLPPWRIPR
jgi:hypothetical protein